MGAIAMKPLFLILLLVASMHGSWAAAQSGRTWNFRAYLDDAVIGTHRFSLRQSGADAELTSEARFDVKLLFINAYKYVHDANERWRGNCLARFASRTDDNGERSEVNAEQQAERVTVSATTGGAPAPARETVDGCLMTYAYWNPEMLKQKRLLNSQTGKVEAVNITALGEDKITVRGAPVTAQRYRISAGKHSIELWYGTDNAWLALVSTLDGGRKLRYLLK